MERITFLIENTYELVTCLLNVEDRQEGLTLERSSGVARESDATVYADSLSDSPVKTRGRGDTRLTLKLLFDTDLDFSTRRAGRRNLPQAPKDVRDLTRPLWELTEYTSSSGRWPGTRVTSTAGAAGTGNALPRVRVFWGMDWEIPAVVESVAERYERFAQDGRPQRSWLTLRLLRVTDETPTMAPSPLHPARDVPEPEVLASRLAAEAPDERKWGVHELLGGGTSGDQLWLLAARYYRDPRLWRLIARANDIADPLRMEAGALLKIPPLSMLARLKLGRSRG